MCCSPGPGERENPPWSKPWFPALEKKVCALSKWSEPNWTTCPVFYPSSAKKSTIVLCFLDDLSFDEGEQEYKILKSAIDGSVTSQPENVLLYVTSNRRHLIKETWKDRKDDADDVYHDDHTNESISLSDRFGLILHYGKLSQEEYLDIIAHELSKKGIALSREELRVEAVRWEMEHSGRNGRIAHQFVTWYVGQCFSQKGQIYLILFLRLHFNLFYGTFRRKMDFC